MNYIHAITELTYHLFPWFCAFILYRFICVLQFYKDEPVEETVKKNTVPVGGCSFECSRDHSFGPDCEFG